MNKNQKQQYCAINLNAMKQKSKSIDNEVSANPFAFQ